MEPFFDAMDVEMSTADLIVCRAGATTLAEITAAGRAAILIPLPTATDDHQRKNADALVAEGAAELLDERELSGRAWRIASWRSPLIPGVVRHSRAERRAWPGPMQPEESSTVCSS